MLPISLAETSHRLGSGALSAVNSHQDKLSIVTTHSIASNLSCNMAPSNSVPQQISDYHVLPIALPPLVAYPTPATHYLYLRTHEPKLPTPSTPRSLFLVNLPTDASEAHIKHLFSSQLGLPSGRIEIVQFEGSKSKALTPLGERAPVATEDANSAKKKGKKRKRGDEGGVALDLECARLPDTWDRGLHRSGSTAVVVFVDRASTDALLKAVKRATKEGTNLVWGEGLEGRLPPLGSASTLPKVILNLQ